jgi:hypothetical protein
MGIILAKNWKPVAVTMMRKNVQAVLVGMIITTNSAGRTDFWKDGRGAGRAQLRHKLPKATLLDVIYCCDSPCTYKW